MSTICASLKGKMLSLSPDELVPNPSQPRRSFDKNGLEALASSIMSVGLIQPVTVRKRVGKPEYEIIAGERRWRASKLAGLKKIPCLLIDTDRKSSALMAFIENSVRSDLSCFEEAGAIRELLQATGMTQNELADALSMSQPALCNKLRLLKLSERERLMALENGFSERQIRALVRLDSEVMRRDAMMKMIEGHLGANETEKLIDSLLSADPPHQKPIVPIAKKPIRRGVISDVRFLYNTLERSVGLLRDAGIDAQWRKKEDELGVEIVISIKNAFQAKKAE